MISLSGVRKRISDEFNIAIDELSIGVGERIALIGTNGSGKTTLIRLLAGVIKADGGTLQNDFQKKSVGYSPQMPYVFRGTVAENIAIGLNGQAKMPGYDERIRRVISLCRLEGLENHQAVKLSGGERQRMFLARMLAGEYRCLLLDEPLSAVDVEMSEYLTSVIVDHCKANGVTLVMSTHLPSQAVKVADRIILMNGGRIEECIDPSNGEDFASDFGRAFVSQWKM